MFPRSCRPGERLLLVAAVVVVAACGRSDDGPRPEDTLILDARAAVAAGDRGKALEMLSQSLAIRPTSYGYYERAKLYADMGKDAESLADCQKGLELHPESRDLNWLQAELKKLPERRFKGASAQPPQKE